MRWRHQIACGIVLTLGGSACADEFTRAAGYYATGQWREAVAAFDQLLTLTPEHAQRVDAEFFRAEALVQMHDYPRAVERFDVFLADHPDHPSAPRARFRIAECRYLSRQWSEAIDLLRRFTQDDSQHELNQYALPYLGFALLESGHHRPAAARQVLEEAMGRYPRGSLAKAVSYRLIELDSRSRDTESMRRRLAVLEREFPRSAEEPEHRYWYGVLYQLTGRPANALTEFARVTSSTAEDRLKGQAWSLAAQVLLEQGDRVAALEQLAQLASLDTDSALVEQSYVQRIRLLMQQQQFTLAKTLIQAFRSRYPTSVLTPEVTRLAGEVSLQDHDFGAAIRSFRELADTHSDGNSSGSPIDQTVTWYQLGRAYYQAGQYAEALTALDHVPASGLPPGVQARAEYARGSILGQLQRPDEALVALDRALASDPDSTFVHRVHWQRVLLLTRAHRWEEAFAEYRQWQPAAAGTWFYRQGGRHLAESAYAAGRYDLASSVFALLLSHLPDDADMAYALSGMAWCYLRQEKWQTAADLFRRVTEQLDDDSQLPAAMLGRAYCLEMSADLTAATEICQQFIQQFPDHPERWRAYLKAADLLRKQQAYTDAVRVLEDGLLVIQDDEARDRMRYLMAWLRRQLGQDAEAGALFQAIHDQGQVGRYWADATYRLADDAFTRQDMNAAERWIAELLQTGTYADRDGIRAHALYLQARIAAQRDDWRGALAALDDLQVGHPDSALITASRVWSVEALYRLGDYDNVRYRLETLRQGDVPLKPAWQRLLDLRQGQSLAASGQWPAALEQVRALAEEEDHDARWAEANLLVARCELQSHQFEQARSTLQKLTANSQKLDGDTVDASWYLTGEAYQGQGQYAPALTAYLHVRTREASQWYAAALLGAAKSLQQLGRREEALSLLHRLADLPTETSSRGQARDLLQGTPRDLNGSRQPQLPVSTTSPTSHGASADQKGKK